MLTTEERLLNLLVANPAAVAVAIVAIMLCGGGAPKPKKSYDDKVAALVASGAAKGFASVSKATTGNQFQYHRAKGQPAKKQGGRVDLSAFNNVVTIDTQAKLVQVEGLATMETVVNALIETSTSRATRRVRSLAMVVKYGLSFISLAKAAIVCELFNKT